MTTDYRVSETELNAFFCDALGVGAQSYGDSGGTNVYDSSAALARHFFGGMREQIRAYQATEAVLATLPVADCRVLGIAYGSRQLGDGRYRHFLSADRLGEGDVLVHDIHAAAVAQLLPHAEATVRARLAWGSRRHHAHTPTDLDSIVRWLDEEAGSDRATRSLMPLAAETETELAGPLEAFDQGRRARQAVQAAQRCADAKRREERLSETLQGLHARLWGTWP